MCEQTQKSNLKRLTQHKPVKVVAVCSGKGGVGKTNVASNLAVALGGLRRNTYLLDADLSLANVDVLLGLQPRFNLSHVVSGATDLPSTIIRGPNNIRIVPAASGNFRMTDLPVAAQVGIIQAFSELADPPEIMVVDTAAGISPNVARFVQAAQHSIVVLRDEPASLTDAYALIKVFSQHYGVSHFHIVTNQTKNATDGRRLFGKLTRVTNSYLDVVLRHAGDIPQDSYLVKAVQEQRAVVDAYPRSTSGAAFRLLAENIESLPAARDATGSIEFFLERLLMHNSKSQGKVA